MAERLIVQMIQCMLLGRYDHAGAHLCSANPDVLPQPSNIAFGEYRRETAWVAALESQLQQGMGHASSNHILRM